MRKRYTKNYSKPREDGLLDEADKQDVEAAFKQFKQAEKGFRKKMADPKTQKKLKESRIAGKTYKEIAGQEKAMADSLDKDLVIAQLDAHIALAVYHHKQTKDQALKSFAKKHDVPLKAVKKIAKGANLI